MHHVRHVIALLLVTAQGVTGLGLGPRALCRDPDGSSRPDSALAPCCCVERRGPACCDDRSHGGTAPAHAHVVRAAAGCGCVHTPIADQPFVTRHRDARSGLDGAAIQVAAAPHALFSPYESPFPARLRYVPLDVGPPGGTALSHLDTVILRL